MAQTFDNLIAHIIFSTKHREPFITAELQPRLYGYIGGILREIGSTPLGIGGVEDHIHLLVTYPPRLAIAELLRVVKANSTRWTRKELGLPFGWQTGYAVFSVSESNVERVRAYIAGQREHHRAVSFEEELLSFLARHSMSYDERYIWD